MAPVRILQRFRDQLRTVALFGVLAVLLGPAQVFPGLLALGVSLERSHTVHVDFDGTNFHLVLSHDGAPVSTTSRGHDCLGSPAHHHGVASRVLCILGDGQGTELDHSASFTAGLAANETVRELVLGESISHQDICHFLLAQGTPVEARFQPWLSQWDHGPPDHPALLASVGTTVLLI